MSCEHIVRGQLTVNVHVVYRPKFMWMPVDIAAQYLRGMGKNGTGQQSWPDCSSLVASEVGYITYSMVDFFTSETPTANCEGGRDAVLVGCLKCCWSTIWLRPDHFSARKMLLSVRIFWMSLIVQYNMDNEHTLVIVLAYLRPSSGSVCAPEGLE